MKALDGNKSEETVCGEVLPQMRSTDIFWAQGMPQFWSMWDCRNCGYHGAFILEDGNIAEKLQADWQQKNKC